MHNEEIRQIVYRQLIGKADDADKAKLQQWLNEDESRREWYEELVSRDNLVKRYETYREADAEEAWKRFDAEKYPKRRFYLRSMLKYAAVALVLIAGIGVYLHRQDSPSVPPVISEDVQTAMQQTAISGRNLAKIEKLSEESAIKEQREILESGHSEADNQPTVNDDDEAEEWLRNAQLATTYHDKEFWLTLSDGTVVHLNYNTRIIYPEKFVGDTRDVIISGDAYFMVAHNDKHPFIVHTANGSVKVYGTEFMVETNSNGSSRVALVKGSVSVTPNNGGEQMMRPGQQATINAQTGQCSLKEVDTAPYVAWNTGSFSFNNTNLENVMNILARWYNVEIVFTDNKQKQEKLYGDFDRYESLDNILSAIRKSTGVQIERVKNKVIIK